MKENNTERKEKERKRKRRHVKIKAQRRLTEQHECVYAPSGLACLVLAQDWFDLYAENNAVKVHVSHCIQ